MIASIRYLDMFTKIDGIWYSVERRLLVDWIEAREVVAPKVKRTSVQPLCRSALASAESNCYRGNQAVVRFGESSSFWAANNRGSELLSACCSKGSHQPGVDHGATASKQQSVARRYCPGLHWNTGKLDGRDVPVPPQWLFQCRVDGLS